MNIDNPSIWVNIMFLAIIVIKYYPKFARQLHLTRKSKSEVDKLEAENKTAERLTLIESIKKLEEQIGEEIQARRRLQGELDDLKQQFAEFKRISTEKEADYLKQINALKKRNIELERKLKSA